MPAMAELSIWMPHNIIPCWCIVWLGVGCTVIFSKRPKKLIISWSETGTVHVEIYLTFFPDVVVSCRAYLFVSKVIFSKPQGEEMITRNQSVRKHGFADLLQCKFHVFPWGCLGVALCGHFPAVYLATVQLWQLFLLGYNLILLQKWIDISSVLVGLHPWQFVFILGIWFV